MKYTTALHTLLNSIRQTAKNIKGNTARGLPVIHSAQDQQGEVGNDRAVYPRIFVPPISKVAINVQQMDKPITDYAVQLRFQVRTDPRADRETEEELLIEADFYADQFINQYNLLLRTGTTYEGVTIVGTMSGTEIARSDENNDYLVTSVLNMTVRVVDPFNHCQI